MSGEKAYSYQAPDRLVYNLLTGAGEYAGLLPTVADYYAKQFEDLGKKDSSPFTYTGERIAGFSPREELAMKMVDQGIGAYQPYFSRAAGLSEEALATLAGGTSEAKAQLLRALGQGEDFTRIGLDRAVGAEGDFRGKLSEAERLAREGQALSDPYLKEAIGEARRSVSDQQGYLKEAQDFTRASTAGFDPSSVSDYMDPYEDAVVQQAMKDIRESQAKSDIGRRAGEVGQGAFGGARSRLTQQESDEATARGLMDAVAGIRSRGYEGARSAAMGEFGRQRGAEAAAAGTTAALGSQAGGARSGLAGLLSSIGGQRGAGMERLSSTVANLGSQGYGAGMGTSGALTSGGQQLYGMGTGASSALSGLAGTLAGGQERGAGAMSGYAGMLPNLMRGDVSSMMDIGAMNRARNQALLDLNYQNFVGQYNLPNQLMSGFANYLTGAGPLAGGVGYSGPATQQPYQTAYTGNYTSYYSDGGQPIPEGNKGLAALAKKAPEVVRKMGFSPAKKNMGGGISSRFPRSSRKLGV